MKRRDPGFARAIKEVGGLSALARKLKMTPQRVGNWHQVPAEFVLKVEKATGGKVTRYEIRPDVFGAAP